MLQTHLLGSFQINNAAVAVALFWLWMKDARAAQGLGDIEAAVRSGLRDTEWPGRLEAIAHDPLTVIDVGHTPDGIRQSLAGLRTIYGARDWILVTGVSIDKKAFEIAGALAPSFDIVICTAAHHKGADPNEIAEAVVRSANPAGRGSRRADHGDGGAPEPNARRLDGPENLCRRRPVPGASRTPRWPVAGARKRFASSETAGARSALDARRKSG